MLNNAKLKTLKSLIKSDNYSSVKHACVPANVLKLASRPFEIRLAKEKQRKLTHTLTHTHSHTHSHTYTHTYTHTHTHTLTHTHTHIHTHTYTHTHTLSHTHTHHTNIKHKF